MELSHLNTHGEMYMVDVGEKRVTRRVALAQAMVHVQPETIQTILDKKIPKGDVFACARLAGIMAAKKTANLIPLCHPILLNGIEVNIEVYKQDTIIIQGSVTCEHVTGVEMEALTCVSVAALTIYDMCKAIDKRMVISDICLLKKVGGKSGDFVR